MKKLFATALLLTAGVSMTAHAGFISGNYTLANGNAVALQGLEWMPLTYTAGLSRTDIEDGFTDRFEGGWNAGDWRYATRAETETLLVSLWDQTFDGWSGTNHAGANWFISTFGGIAFDDGYGDNRIAGTSNDDGFKNTDHSMFYFGEDGACFFTEDSSCFGTVVIAESYENYMMTYNVKTGRDELAYTPNTTPLGYFLDDLGLAAGRIDGNLSTTKTFARNDFGSLLVRIPSNGTPSTVPAPTAISLLVLGLCGLILQRRRKAYK